MVMPFPNIRIARNTFFLLPYMCFYSTENSILNCLNIFSLFNCLEVFVQLFKVFVNWFKVPFQFLREYFQPFLKKDHHNVWKCLLPIFAQPGINFLSSPTCISCQLRISFYVISTAKRCSQNQCLQRFPIHLQLSGI